MWWWGAAFSWRVALFLLAMTECRYDVMIIGGGVVGLAFALEITRRLQYLRLLLLEKEQCVARHQSGHNSGVIHSGVYYKPGSLKAHLDRNHSAPPIFTFVAARERTVRCPPPERSQQWRHSFRRLLQAGLSQGSS